MRLETVYVVFADEYEDRHIKAIFDTRENAKEYIRQSVETARKELPLRIELYMHESDYQIEAHPLRTKETLHQS